MASPDLAIVEEPQASNAESSGSADSYGNSVQTDPPVYAYPSNNTVDPEDQTSLPYLGVRQARYHGVLVSIVTVTDRSPGHNASLNTEFSHPVLYTLLS